MFFTTQSESSQAATGTIESATITDNVLTLEIISDGGKYTADFWIDLKSRKVTKSVVNGKEMNLNTGAPYAVPLHKD